MSTGKIKAGIIGAAGYTGGELTRILLNHPGVELVFLRSTSHAGQPVSKVHGDLEGETDLVFSKDVNWDIDVLFLCSGHGKSLEFMNANRVPEGMKIIDLSADYRPLENGEGFVYGLPELYGNTIKKATRIANPGCFATCIQLGLLPLAAKGKLGSEVHVQAITGSTGAGAGLSQTSHFSWRNNNISVYKAFNHQHLDEISQNLESAAGNKGVQINFVPLRGDFTRGIFASMYTEYDGTLEEAQQLYGNFFETSEFTHLVTDNPSLKQVINTNKCLVYLEKHGSKLLIISLLDNLLKGASGQAVQNMNLMFGLGERSGLSLKGTAF